MSLLATLISSLLDHQGTTPAAALQQHQESPSAALYHQGDTRSTGGRGEVEGEEVRGALAEIEGKYERILRDLTEKRRAAAFSQYQPRHQVG